MPHEILSNVYSVSGFQGNPKLIEEYFFSYTYFEEISFPLWLNRRGESSYISISWIVFMGIYFLKMFFKLYIGLLMQSIFCMNYFAQFTNSKEYKNK